jgi:hypothetical protein
MTDGAEGDPRADSPASDEVAQPSYADQMARPLVAPTRPRPRTEAPDPWAHRRGEPRLFALLWTIYLFVATAITMLRVVSHGFPGGEAMRPAARAMLITVAAGIALVWPLIRLSQRRDDRPLAAVVHDLVVILVPVQAIVWPQALWWLGRWPLDVVAAVAAMLTAWSFLVGGLIALAYASEGATPLRPSGRAGARRAAWMVLMVGLALLPAVPAVFGQPTESGRWWWMLSPLTAAAELVRDRSWSGVTAAATDTHWWFIAGTAIVACPIWLAAGSASVRPTRAGRRLAAGLD